MVDLISASTGSITTAVFKTTETGATCKQISHAASTDTTAAWVQSKFFTMTNADVLDGVLCYCQQLTTTSTVSVAIFNGALFDHGLQVNATDLPTNPSWVFFKFAATLTADGGADYSVRIKAGSAANAKFYSSTTTEWTRIVRTTTTATAAAADVLYIAGEQTGAAAETPITIYMNSVAATDYGAIEIGNIGTLKYETMGSKAYILKTSGVMEVWGDGILNIGTVATPIPRTSTASLYFDCVSDGDFGLKVENGGTFYSQGQSRTAAKSVVSCYLNAYAAAGSKTLQVDRDTGWLQNDYIALAPTRQTYSEYESRQLYANATGSTVSCILATTYIHSGSTPTAAECILLNRNVSIRTGSTLTAAAYCYLAATSTVSVAWTDFRYIGTSTTGKRGIEIATTTGTCNIGYSSIRDCKQYMIFVVSASGSNINIHHNNLYNLTTGTSMIFLTATSGTNIFSNNILIGIVASSSYGFSLSDIGCTITNNYVSGIYGTAFICQEVTVPLGTFSGNVAHSNFKSGFDSTQDITNGTISNCKFWRNNGGAGSEAGIRMTSTNKNLTFSNVVLFGNNLYNFCTDYYFTDFIFNSCNFNGDSTFATTNGIYLTSRFLQNIFFENCNFGVAGTGLTTHTNDINLSGTRMSCSNIVLRNCNLASGTEITGQSNFNDDTYDMIRSAKHDATAGKHRTWKKYGIIDIDTTAGLWRTASPSERVTVTTGSSGVAESGHKKAAVASGGTITVNVYVRASTAGDGAVYNGVYPTLVLKKNVAAGITADTVLATATDAGKGSFELLTNTTAVVSDDAILEFCVNSGGAGHTSGWINIDDWSVS